MAVGKEVKAIPCLFDLVFVISGISGSGMMMMMMMMKPSTFQEVNLDPRFKIRAYTLARCGGGLGHASMAESMAKLVKPCRCPVWYYLLLAVACVASVHPWHFVGPKRPNAKRAPFPQSRRAAEGYFPGVDVELPEPPSRGSLLEKLQSSIAEDPSVGEHTEEVKLLREQTAILAQELRLLKELLQDGVLADAIELSLSKVTSEVHEPSLSRSPPEEPKEPCLK